MAPHALKGGFGTFGIPTEVPWGGQCYDALDGNKVSGSNRHRSAEAIANKRRRFTNAAQQWQKQFFDMVRDRQAFALISAAPIDQQCVPAHARNGTGKRNFLIKIQNSWRIDQRGNQDKWRPMTTMIAQCSACHTFNHGLVASSLKPRREGISAKSDKGIGSEPGVALRYFANQLEK